MAHGFGDSAARKLQEVVLSNDAFRRRIDDLSIGIRDKLIVDLKAFAIKLPFQLDESTDLNSVS